MTVAAVIPALNEELTIAQVVGVVRAHPQVAEVIVVSDGSTDDTAVLARAAGARVVELRENQGKAAAMAVGVEQTSADHILFLDGDLIGLTEIHITALLTPVLFGTAGMSVGIFRHGRIATDLAQVVAPYLSGLRVLKRELMADMLAEQEDVEISRFGIEVALTLHAKRRGYDVVEVTMEDMTHRMKEEKLGLVKGFAARMKMYREILSYAIKQGLER